MLLNNDQPKLPTFPGMRSLSQTLNHKHSALYQYTASAVTKATKFHTPLALDALEHWYCRHTIGTKFLASSNEIACLLEFISKSQKRVSGFEHERTVTAMASRTSKQLRRGGTLTTSAYQHSLLARPPCLASSLGLHRP